MLLMKNFGSEKELAEFVDRLPHTDDSSLFGLPPNIYQITAERDIMRDMRTMNRFSAELLSATNSVDIAKSKLRSVEEIIVILRTNVKSFTAIEADVKKPMRNCLIRERNVLAQLLDNILKTLTLVMDSQGRVLGKLLDDIFMGTIPETWDIFDDGVGNSLLFVSNQITRLNYIENLISRSGEDVTFDENKPLDLTMIPNPTTILNVWRQIQSRKSKTPFDKLSIKFSFAKSDPKSNCIPISGVKCQGFLIANDGLVSLIDSPIAISVSAAPLCFVSFTAQESVSTARLPLYANISREKHIMDISVNANVPEKNLLLAGAAFVLN